MRGRLRQACQGLDFDTPSPPIKYPQSNTFLNKPGGLS